MKAFFTPYIYIVFFGLYSNSIHAQNWQLQIISKDSISSKIIKGVTFKKLHIDEKAIYKEIDTILVQLESLGAFTPQLELLNIVDKTYHFQLMVGPIFKDITLYVDDTFSENIFLSLGFNPENRSITIPTNEIPSLLNSIISTLDNNGFVFAEVSLVHHQITNHQLSATIKVDHHQQRTIDKITIEGYSNFPSSFIKHQTPLKIGNPFNQQKLIKTSHALQQLHFVSELKPPEVLFTNDSTMVYLYLNKKKAHQFDGLIGFNTTENNSKIKLHGYIEVQLNNMLNRGELFNIYWQNTTQKQTSFKLYSRIPYLFKSPISFEGTFVLHKQDSTYLTTSFNASFLYHKNNHLLKTEIQQQTSTLLTSVSNSLLNDYQKNYYGLSYFYLLNNFNRFFTTEFESQFSAYTGTRKTTTGRSDQQKIKYLVNYTWEINPRNYVFIQNQSEKLMGNDFYLNELLLLGGTNTIRGFNENQLLSSAYSFLNLEYRYITSNESYFYTITDYGVTKNKTLHTNHHLMGIGLGYVFRINTGFLNISYSLGKFSDTSFDFGQAKVHLKWMQHF